MKRIVLVVVGLLILGAGAFGALTFHPAIAAIEPPAATSFTEDDIAKGEALVGLGDCAVCHTKPGGRPLAGGFPLPTPFGLLYSTNITPDKETGIGAWSLEAFQRAMREGVDREGHHLYPAFPYDHFTKVTPEDVKAIYAYLMTRPAVAQPAVANDLRFPFNIRPLVAGWNLLFLQRGPYVPDPSKDAKWNRGAYLVEGLAHCSACHTPRNVFGAEDRGKVYGGGDAENWFSPPLGTGSLAPVPWTRDALAVFLTDGWDENHGVAGGPMTEVVNQLANQRNADLDAIFTYLVSLYGEPPAGKADAAKAFADEREFSGIPGPAQPKADTPEARGEALFSRSCANCHRKGSQTVPLALGTALQNPDPRNAIHVILDGIRPPEGAPERSMPRFGTTFNDDQMVDLMTFLRARYSKAPAWTDIAAQVKAARPATAGTAQPAKP